MSAEENKVLVRRFVEEFWNEGILSAADELMAEDAEIHMPTGEILGLDELKSFAATWRESFPDWHSTSRIFCGRRQGSRTVDWPGHTPGRGVGHTSHRQARRGARKRLLSDRRREDRGVQGAIRHDGPDAAIGRHSLTAASRSLNREAVSLRGRVQMKEQSNGTAGSRRLRRRSPRVAGSGSRTELAAHPGADRTPSGRGRGWRNVPT